MQNLLNDLKELLKNDDRLMVGDDLLKNKIIELSLKLDKDLIKLLLSHEQIKRHFFTDIDGTLVFDKDKFMRFVSNKAFLPDSYTSFKNKIGLTVDGDYLSEGKEVVLAWPYKDCVLEGGQTREDAKRKEIFWNEILAPDEIDRLFDPKVLTSFKRIDKKGEHKLTELKDRDNLIIKGNNLLALHSLKKRFARKVKLIYIDPPYNTGNDSFGYNDSFNHSTWLTFMKNRLEVARDLLREDGVIFVQCDDSEQAYLKVLMDQLFGKENFVNCIAVKMAEPTGVKMAHAAIRFPKIKDYLLFYKYNYFKFENIDKTQKEIWDVEYKLFLENFTIEERNSLKEIQSKTENNEEDVATAMKLLSKAKIIGIADKLNDLKISKTKQDAWKLENAWRIIQTVSSDSIRNFVKNLKEIPSQDIGVGLSKEKKIFFYNTKANLGASGRIRVTFADAFLHVNPCDFWQDIKTTGIAKEGRVALRYGKKPEKLIYRIIYMTTNYNDIVLDFNLGSGTTAAVAHKMGRQYIGDEQLDYGKNDSVVRLKNVIAGDQSGISKRVGWKGGGDFIYCELMKWNELYIERIQQAKSKKELQQIWETMKEKAFLSYKVDHKQFDENAKEFGELSVEDQKKFLIEVLDKNQLYVNLSEIDDSDYKVSEEDKKLNRQFYNKY